MIHFRSHSTSALLQLRDMVPPQSANSAAQDGTDSKRPKHVVLSDTIQLIRDLQDKVSFLKRCAVLLLVGRAPG